MLFEMNQNGNDFYDMNLDYFNIDSSNISSSYIDTNVVDEDTALMLGNSFKDEYEGYKNFKPRKIVVNTEREKMLLMIQELDFIMNDLALKLDVNPNDLELYELFKNYANKLKQMCEEYSKKYQPLEIVKDTNGKYSWIDSPWPWDGGMRYV